MGTVAPTLFSTVWPWLLLSTRRRPTVWSRGASMICVRKSSTVGIFVLKRSPLVAQSSITCISSSRPRHEAYDVVDLHERHSKRVPSLLFHCVALKLV